jgi:hypothetical protein
MLVKQGRAVHHDIPVLAVFVQHAAIFVVDNIPLVQTGNMFADFLSERILYDIQKICAKYFQPGCIPEFPRYAYCSP